MALDAAVCSPNCWCKKKKDLGNDDKK